MFDVSNLAPRDQFEAAVVVSGMCLVAAILLREWFADREIRALARILGVAGYAVVVAFAWKVTVTNETLATQLLTRGKQDATSIADETRFVAVASEYTATVGNQSFSVVRFSEGRERPVSITARRENRVWTAGSGDVCGVRGGTSAGRGTSDCLDDVRNGKQSAVTF